MLKLKFRFPGDTHLPVSVTKHSCWMYLFQSATGTCMFVLRVNRLSHAMSREVYSVFIKNKPAVPKFLWFPRWNTLLYFFIPVVIWITDVTFSEVKMKHMFWMNDWNICIGKKQACKFWGQGHPHITQADRPVLGIVAVHVEQRNYCSPKEMTPVSQVVYIRAKEKKNPTYISVSFFFIRGHKWKS